MTHLLRANEKGDILDADGKVVGRVVPVEPTEAQVISGTNAVIGGFESDKPSPLIAYCTYLEMLSAAAIDLAGVAVKIPSTYGWQSKGMEYDLGYKDGFTAAIDALGVKP